MNAEYRIRHAVSAEDALRLKTLYSTVFHPDPVGILAETMFHYLPRLGKENWFIAEHRATGLVVAGLVLIPWTWEMEGVALRVAEMGIVGTLKEHRGRGLIRALSEEFDKTLAEQTFDLAVIQGIAGFYNRFGYHYALPLENHVNLALHAVPDLKELYTFRLATQKDIPFLMREDAVYRRSHCLSAFRDEANWRYILTHSATTVNGSELWIISRGNGGPSYYFRIPHQGFGTGLIVSEVSDGIPFDALAQMLAFCKRKAVGRGKPYIRLNLHNEARPARMAIAMGAERGTPYAWQVKAPDVERFLKSIAAVLERRMSAGACPSFSGIFRLHRYGAGLDLTWEDARLVSIGPAEGDSEEGLHISPDLLPALLLGHRTWRELRYIRPDVRLNRGRSALLVDALFPQRVSWIHEQY